MSSRKAEILDSVDRMVKAHDEWEQDETAPQQPSRKLELTIEDALAECLNGDVPAECREVVAAMDAFGREWERYKNGYWDRLDRPLGSFWEAFRRVLAAREGSEVQKPKRPEPVHVLRKQNVSDLVIAKAYGLRDSNGSWSGPFFGPGGNVLVDKIEREARDEFSVIPQEWVHPAEQQRIREHDRLVQSRLQRVEQREKAFVPDAAGVQGMLLEGAYEHQIVKACGVTVEEVRAAAARLGVKVESAPNVAAERGTFDRPLTDADHRAFPGSHGVTAGAEGSGTEAAQSGGPATKASDENRVRERVIELFEGEQELTASEITQLINDENEEQVVTVQKVNGLIRQHKRRLDPAGAAKETRPS